MTISIFFIQVSLLSLNIVALVISDSGRPVRLAVSAKASCLRALPAVSILDSKALISA